MNGCVLISVILLYNSNLCHWVCRKGDTDKTESQRVQKLSHCGARITVAGVMPLSMKRGHHDLRVELFRPNEGNKKEKKRRIRRYIWYRHWNAEMRIVGSRKSQFRYITNWWIFHSWM